MEKLTLQAILEVFNAPVNEEQAWAVCYQCAKYLQSRWQKDPTECFRLNGVRSLQLCKDGNVSEIVQGKDGMVHRADTEYDLVQSLGVVVFQALDYGLSESEEHKLSPPLEQLIEKMTVSELDEEDMTADTQIEADHDEGIEHDAGDEENGDITQHKLTLDDVIQTCTNHFTAPMEAGNHYKAVCRALVTEALELITFLEKISSDKKNLRTDQMRHDTEDGPSLEELQRADWARVWIQVMRQLRHGVKLKKVDQINMQPLEYELTPYEILMEDIRARRYTLNEIMVNGDIPPKMKQDAHEIILEFIRSRPPLHPVKERVLNTPPPKDVNLREQILQAIRSEPKLRPTPGRVVETSRTKLDDDDTNPAPPRKIIKPDLSLLMSNSFDEEDEEDDDDAFGEDRNKVEPSPLSPLTPFSPETPKMEPPDSPWQQKVALDIATQLDPFRPDRRHSITVCESPSSPHVEALCLEDAPRRTLPCGINYEPDTDTNIPKNIQSSLECLSLTVEEVMHIRNVLTKAELECLVLDPQLQTLLAKGKVCFTCKQTKFSLFGQWGTKCKFCRRNVCSKCCTKMRIPTEHFEHIPVYTLSPSPMSPNSCQEMFAYEMTGSVPTTPEMPRKFVPQPDVLNNNKNKRPARPQLQRAQTVMQPPPPSKTLQGPLMNICKDCKTMIVNIIRASRSSLASAPDIVRRKTNFTDFSPHRAMRNFHLDLKPVYK